MDHNIARIPVQNSFCKKTCDKIRVEIEKVLNSNNVVFYPSDALVVFNFKKANELSEVLNILTVLGYPPAGDRVVQRILIICLFSILKSDNISKIESILVDLREFPKFNINLGVLLKITP